MTHGTITTYTDGKCRCQSCREAMSAYVTARRAWHAARPAETPDHVHGTANGYRLYGCRCALCRDAAKAENEAKRRRIRAKADA